MARGYEWGGLVWEREAPGQNRGAGGQRRCGDRAETGPGAPWAAERGPRGWRGPGDIVTPSVTEAGGAAALAGEGPPGPGLRPRPASLPLVKRRLLHWRARVPPPRGMPGGSGVAHGGLAHGKCQVKRQL